MVDRPSNPGQMTEEEQKRVHQWWERFGKKATCGVCQTNKWTVLDHFTTPLTISGAGHNDLNLGGTIFPCLLFTCDTCGNVITVNAIKSGVLAPEEKGGAK